MDIPPDNFILNDLLSKSWVFSNKIILGNEGEY